MRWTGFGQVLAPGGDLDEQRIVVSGEHGARVGGAAIEADAESRGRAIGGNFSVVGREIFLGIFGGDAALQRRAVQRNVRLLRQATSVARAANGLARRESATAPGRCR